MTQVPELLRESFSDFDDETISAWWAELDESSRAEVIELWRATGCESSTRARVTLICVEEEEEEDESVVWHSDFYEYLVNHEAAYLEIRRFHICTRHPEAAAAVKAGYLPSGYICPLDRSDCPMMKALHWAPGKSLKFRLAFAPRELSD